MSRKRERPYSYMRALIWIIDHDDCTWLEQAYGTNSLACLALAAIYDRTNEEIRRDLLKLYARNYQNNFLDSYPNYLKG